MLYAVRSPRPARFCVPLIYKICPEPLWREAEAAGRFAGAAIDLADGYIHFSTGGQLRETAAKHFSGQRGLLLIAVDDAGLGSALRYEPSRGGALFPHLYAALEPKSVRWVAPLAEGHDGQHIVPEDIA
ncbi:DUF952 domain-containing protein [Bosea sp. 124]|uniref:DUF952 domain-containing protein n=1 Tax=Bosea sp. 124 TaxID=2135642 RepID=UPI0015E63B7A|nr:DUF952 domain-containing protein [Bosea sp. 124]